MEYETINKETPEMKELISGIKEVSKRIREIAQTHCPLFGGEIYLTGREVCEHLFVSPRTLQDYRDRGIIPYTQIAGKILYRLSDRKTRSHTDNFGENNVKCLIAKGICRFVPHSSAGGF